MSGGRPGSSPAAAELWRLLSHARGCDGHREDPETGRLVACKTCKHIDRWLDDGSGYFADDPVQRIDALGKALDVVIRQADRLASFLELGGSKSTRDCAIQLVEWLQKTRTILTLPITEVPGYTPPAKPVGFVAPSSTRPRRREGPTAVTRSGEVLTLVASAVE